MRSALLTSDLGFACQAQGYERAAVPTIVNEKRQTSLTSDLGPRPVIGGLRLRNASDDAIFNFCSNVTNSLNAMIECDLGSSSQILQDLASKAKRLLFGLTVICSGTNGPADAQTIALLASPASFDEVAILNMDISNAQTVADADTELATDSANSDPLDAIQDICTSLQEFIDMDCDDDDMLGVCSMLGVFINNQCINGITAVAPTSNDR
jgi:hypothetical protein